MADAVGNSLRIPNFLTAGTPQGLRRLMLLNNIKNAKQYNYFDLQFVNGKWFVWYFESENIDGLLNQKESISVGGINGNTKE
jgi:hypothetical protein